MDSPKPPRKAPLGPALRALAARARRDLGSHPDADDLVAYSERRLEERDAERIRDHLALCGDCAGLLLDLGALSENDAAAASGLTDGDVEEAWRSFAARLAATAPRERMRRRRRAAPWLPWAVAATLLAGVVALSAWVGVLRHDLRSLSRPRADAVLANLEPRGENSRGTAGTGEERPRADRPATLILHSSPSRTYPRYELQIREARLGERLLWHDEGLRPRDLGIFVLDLPAGALPPGNYQLRLYGLDAQRRDLLADYDMALAPGGGRGAAGATGAAGGFAAED
jgi:hypothetical protein